jgi:hypothetical protein
MGKKSMVVFVCLLVFFCFGCDDPAPHLDHDPPDLDWDYPSCHDGFDYCSCHTERISICGDAVLKLCEGLNGFDEADKSIIEDKCVFEWNGKSADWQESIISGWDSEKAKFVHGYYKDFHDPFSSDIIWLYRRVYIKNDPNCGGIGTEGVYFCQSEIEDLEVMQPEMICYKDVSPGDNCQDGTPLPL